jgi:non-ribosomal peptide synthetase component E (peptide arylation enzyme)
MKRIIVLAVAAALGAFALSGLGQAATPKLVGTSGPGYSIRVTKGGKLVKTLKHGTYKIVVRDKSSAHNFHLFGPGVNKTTSVPFTGTKTWTVKLKKGKYTYQCDVHASVGMKGSFSVS